MRKNLGGKVDRDEETRKVAVPFQRSICLCPSLILRTSLVAQLVNNLPTMQETWVGPLGQGDALEKEMATHSCILAWRTSWTEEPGRLQSMRSQELDMA